MKTPALYYSLLIALLLPIFSIAQTAQDSASVNEKATFKLGIYYNTHLHYYGRTDSIPISGIFPVAEFWLNKNLYLTAAPVFVYASESGTDYAGTVAVAGYRFGKENHTAGNIYLVKPFYRDDAKLVQSALKAQLAGSATWLNKMINFTGGADVKLSDKIDVGVMAGLDHIFRLQLAPSSVIVVDPTATINAGTRHFSQTYNKQSGFLFFPGPQQQVTENVSDFTILSYELSVPVVFATGKFQLIATPAYVIPQNLLPGEHGENLLYATLGAKWTF